MYRKIVILSCNWDGWSCIDAAANAGLSYPFSATVIRLSCLSGINVGLILRAFEYGADGLLLIGCQERECQYGRYSRDIDSEFDRAVRLLHMLGIDKKRLKMVHLAPFDGEGFISSLNIFSNELRSIGNDGTVAGLKEKH